MKALLQRVKKASVSIDGRIFSEIGQGLLIFLGVEKNDSFEQAEFLANKITNLRVFEDSSQKMNLSVKDVCGEVLIVSQFTLASDCKKGTRPSFDNAKEPVAAKEIYEKFIYNVKGNNIGVKTGVFGAMMEISILNDGPVTFMLTKD